MLLHKGLSSHASLFADIFLITTLFTPMPSFALRASQDATARPASDANLLTQGRELGSKHQWKQAEAVLRRYHLAHPDSEQGEVLHAEAMVEMGEPFDAALELQSFLKQHPNAIRALELHAVLAVDSLRDRMLAQGDLEKVVQLDPRDFQAWNSLGTIYVDEVKPAEAARAYATALRLKPTDAKTAADLASSNDKAGFPAKAKAEFDQALRLAKASSTSALDRAYVNYAYGRFLLDSGKNSLSVEALTRAINLSPHSATSYYWRARAFQSLHQNEKAIADAEKSADLDPGNKDAPYLLLSLYRQQGNMKEASKYAARVQSLSDAEQKQAAFGRTLRNSLDKAESLLRHGDYADASVQYETIVTMLPSFYEAYFGLGMCYAQTGRSDEAIDAFRKYVAMQPLSSDGHASLGILLLSQHRPSEAIPELKKALAIDPTMQEARKALGQADLEISPPVAETPIAH